SMVRCALALRETWRDGQDLNMATEMMGLTLAIVGKALFNSDVAVEARKVQQALEIILPMDMRYLPPLGWLMRRLPLPSNYRFKQAVRELDEILFRMIEEHRRSGDQGDLLSMLLEAQDEEDGAGMTDRQIRDEALTLFLAGHESTALAITWTWYLLSQHPEVEAKFHQELDEVFQGREPTADDYARLTYTRWVLAESMRLYPPVYINGREALEDTTLGGYTIPKGAQIIYSSYVTQRDPRFFPHPERFDPERWRPEIAEKRHKFAYIPFGAGRRLCIGEPFAWMEGVLVLATLGQRWQARLDPAHSVGLDPRITLRPRNGMPMSLHRRPGAP
ncbi:MAG: cytochrome P450, partial [Candidatus Hydrogenedentes bacterium]|nr:cytochrome P450 [Candidatus Hydrogenedentota bacterium]